MKKSISLTLLSLMIVVCAAGVYRLARVEANNVDQSESSPMLVKAEDESRYIPPAGRVSDDWIDEAETETTRLDIQNDPDDDLPEIDADELKSDDKPDRRNDDPVNNIALNTKQPGLAVIPFKQSKTIREEDAGSTLANLLLSEIDSATYTIFERGQISALLEEAKFQESDLVDSTARAVEFGKLAGIRYLVIGELSKLGKIRWTARVIDCQTGEIGDKGSVSFLTFQEIDSAIPEMLAVLKLNDASLVVSDDPEPMDDSPGGAVGKPRRPLTGNDLIDANNPDSVFSVQLTTREEKTAYIEGETISFEIKADMDCFLTLLAVDPIGDITLLMPNRWQHRAFVRKGESITLPSLGMEFQFPIQPPHGQTIVKLIATTVPFTLRNVDSKRLDEEGFVNGGNLRDGSKAIGVAGDENELIALSKPSVISDRFKAHQWTTAELTITSRASPAEPAVSPGDQEPTNPDPASSPVRSEPRYSGKKPLAPDSSGIDPNDEVVRRWVQFAPKARPVGWDKSISMLSRSSSSNPTHMEGLLLIRGAMLGAKGLGGEASGYRTEQVDWPQGQKGIGQDWEVYAEQLKAKDPSIITVIPNRVVHIHGPVPSTLLADVQWALKNSYYTELDTAWSEAQINFPPPEDMPLVAVVDQGADVEDSRIAQYLWTNSGEIPENGIDDDKNGFVDDVHGYHFAHRTASLSDPRASMNHGSAVSSIIASVPVGRKSDVIGIAPGVRVMNVGSMRLYPESEAGSGSQSDTLDAIYYAMSNGAKIINLSLGAQASFAEVIAYNQHPVWNLLEKNGVLVIVSAGNDNSNNDEYPATPANLSQLRSNVITVMAIDAAGQRARFFNPESKKWEPFSNYGKETVQIAAPGTSMLGIPLLDNIAILDGTSFSAPVVAGAAALVWGKHPDWDYTLVKRAILESARQVEGFEEFCTTGGMLDIQAALEWLP